MVPIPTGTVGKVLNRALDQVGDPGSTAPTVPTPGTAPASPPRPGSAADVALPHQSEAQQRGVKNVALADAQPGDIFWREGYVAIYLGTVGE